MAADSRPVVRFVFVVRAILFSLTEAYWRVNAAPAATNKAAFKVKIHANLLEIGI